MKESADIWVHVSFRRKYELQPKRKFHLQFTPGSAKSFCSISAAYPCFYVPFAPPSALLIAELSVIIFENEQ